MCTVVLLNRPGHDWPLILAANRDEMIARPWSPPARHWPDRPDVIAGKDDLAGGTWLGRNDAGVIAAVLNRRESLGPKQGFRSRGELPLEALDHAEAAAAAEALAAIEPRSYRAFNMVVADRHGAFWIRAAGAEADAGADNVTVRPIPPGLTMLTSRDLDDKSSPRIRTYRPRFRKAAEPDPGAPEGTGWAAWQRLLASRLFDPDDGPEGAMTIVTDKGFGTVSSSLLALPGPAQAEVRPVWLFTAGPPGETPWETVAG